MIHWILGTNYEKLSGLVLEELCCRKSKRAKPPKVLAQHACGCVVLVEVVQAANVPFESLEVTKCIDHNLRGNGRPRFLDTDWRSDPYVEVSIVRAASADQATLAAACADMEAQVERVTPRQKVRVVWNDHNPIFHAWLSFAKVDPADRALLLDCQLLDYNQLTKSNLLGWVRVPLGDFFNGEKRTYNMEFAPGVIPLQAVGDRASDDGEVLPCQLDLRCLRCVPLEKRVFLIRHGESTWNQGQNNLELGRMAGFDHPLSGAGINQALSLNKMWLSAAEDIVPVDSEYECPLAPLHYFLNAATVFSSPLTRALQTCLLALQGHPALAQEPVRLLACAREIKKSFGLDCVGLVSGESIEGRARDQLAAMMGALEEFTLAGSVDPYSCNYEWWTHTSATDSKADIDRRLAEFVSVLLGAPGDSCIVTGHSLYFQELFRSKTSPGLVAQRPDEVEYLRTVKLGNAECIMVVLGCNPATGDCMVVDFEPMFGLVLGDVEGFPVGTTATSRSSSGRPRSRTRTRSGKDAEATDSYPSQ